MLHGELLSCSDWFCGKLSVIGVEKKLGGKFWTLTLPPLTWLAHTGVVNDLPQFVVLVATQKYVNYAN